jgi:Tol biopolymer transport system component
VVAGRIAHRLRQADPQPGRTQIWVVRARPRHLHTRLVADPIDPFGTSWSPDGKWLAYERDGDIYAVDVDGGEPLQVTAGPEEDGMPVWQPTKEQAGS